MNMQKRTLSTIAATAIVLAVGISTAVAQGPGGRGSGQGPGFGRGPGSDGGFPMLRQLNLTDAQREQIKALMEEQRNQNDGTGAKKVGELQQALQTAILADAPDTAQIDQLRAQIGDAEAAALAARVDLQLKIAQILTPEQRQQAREAVGKRPRSH